MIRDDDTDLGRALRRLAAAGEDIAALRAQLAEAREVVRPFAELSLIYEEWRIPGIAFPYNEKRRDDYVVEQGSIPIDEATARRIILRVGSFRDARDFLAKMEPEI